MRCARLYGEYDPGTRIGILDRRTVHLLTSVPQVVLSIEAAIIANFIPSNNLNALRAGVAFLFLIEVPYDFGLNGMQFIYRTYFLTTNIYLRQVLMTLAT